MYAVFRSGGKQYRAAKGDVLRLERLDADEGASISFDEVLLVGEGAEVQVGNPMLAGTTVSGKVVRQGKSRKVPVVKFRRRQNYLRQGTHRQFFTEVEITAIAGSGAEPAATASVAEPAAKKVAKKKVAKKAAATAAPKKTAPKKAAAKKTAKKKAAKE
jgi:large subunit ribosomal protein L21